MHSQANTRLSVVHESHEKIFEGKFADLFTEWKAQWSPMDEMKAQKEGKESKDTIFQRLTDLGAKFVFEASLKSAKEGKKALQTLKDVYMKNDLRIYNNTFWTEYLEAAIQRKLELEEESRTTEVHKITHKKGQELRHAANI